MGTPDRKGPFFDVNLTGTVAGRRHHYELTVLGAGSSGAAFGLHSYPEVSFRTDDAMYFASPSLAYTVVRAEEPNEFGFSEIAWTTLGNIRLWGALAFSIVEGNGFYSFYPLASRELYFADLQDERRIRGIAERAAAEHEPQSIHLHRVQPSAEHVGELYAALIRADNTLLRGVNCYLKAHLLWGHPLFCEEMGFNLYIALEGGLSVLRRRLGAAAGRDVGFRAVFDFVRKTFSYGEALAEYWEDAHDDRNALLHPDNDFSPYVIQPMSADDILELFDPMLSLYRYLLVGELRPVSFK